MMSGHGKRWRWVALLLVIAVIFVAVRAMNKSIEVVTDSARKLVLELTVAATATGTIKSDTEVNVAAQRAGRISAIEVVEGDVVKKGDMIAKLDLAEADINLKKARATLSRAEAMLAELRASYEALEAEVDAQVARAKATYEDAMSRHERYDELFKKGFVSKDEFDKATTEFNIAKAEYDSALAGSAKLGAKESEIEAQEAALIEAREAMKLAKLNYDYSFLHSPIDGIITSVPVKLGETITAGALVAEVIATESLYVEAFVDEADVGKVKLGQEVVISMDAYPGKSLHGEVYMISPVVLGEKHETRTFEVRTRVKEDVDLKPGMSADVEIIIGREDNTLSVPSQAVIERGGEHFVYVKDGSKARLRKVRIGLYNWTLTQIVEGVKEGDEVVTNPDVKGLEDGVRIKAKKR